MPTNPCSIDGCDKPARGRGWCVKHWKRWRTHGDPLYVRPAPLPPPRCAVADCNKPKHGFIYCSKHYQRYVKSGDPLISGDHYPGRPRIAEPSYDGVHKRLSREKGAAAARFCVDCGGQADEWSYDGGCPHELVGEVRGSILAYSVDQSRYSPRCRPCHRAMDDSLLRDRNADGRWAPGNPGVTIHSIRTDRSAS